MREISCGGEQGGFCFHGSEIMSFGPVWLVIDSIQDLSDPLVVFSKMAVAGIQMRADEINAQGAIHQMRLMKCMPVALEA